MHHASFLPEDYLAQKAERRTNLICLTLFVVVMIAVFGAFLVTNRQWTHVKRSQEAVNRRYREAAQQIQGLTKLENQREQMLAKAQLAAALVERVPRSILLAGLINRMPDRMTLTSFELQSKQIRPARTTGSKRKGARRASVRRARTRQQAKAEIPKAEPPRYEVKVTMMGTAPTDLEVSHFMSELNDYALLSSVSLDYSEEKEVDGRVMRRFKIHMELDPNADVRSVDALARPIKDPTSDRLMLGAGGLEGGR